MASTTEAPTDSEVESSPSTLTNGEHITTLSLSTAANTTNTTSSLNATRMELEKWQLQHTNQLLKLEVAQKNIIIDTMKTDHSQLIEELEENITELKCDRKMLQERLKALTKVYEEEKLSLQKQLKDALKPHPPSPPMTSLNDIIMSHLEGPLLQGITIISEELYKELVQRDISLLTPQDLIQVRFYEVSRSFINEGVWLREENNRLQLCLEEERKEKDDLIKKLKDHQSEVDRLHVRVDQLNQEKSALVSLRQERDFKSEHYDIVKSERDSYEKELSVIKQSLIGKEFKEKGMIEEKERMSVELSTAHHSVSLLKQDKEYLQKQVIELSQRARESEEKGEGLERRLNECKQSKEEIYEQMIKQKQEQKEDYDNRLQKELDSLRLKTNSQIDQLKVQTREMYERENRVLVQARDSAVTDRDRAIEKQKELEMKYEHVFNELRQLQVSSDGHVSELNSEVQMKLFELDRVRVLYEEAISNLKRSEKERQLLREKLESLGNQSECTVRDLQSLVKELESKLKDKTERLTTYEKLEHELDDVVMQAATLEDEEDAQKVLLSYGFGTSIPSSSRRRIQQSVQLARRVLKLERINASLRHQIEGEEKDRQTLKDELVRLKTQFELASQPHKYLLETLNTRDSNLKKLKTANSNLESKIGDLEKKLSQVTKDKNSLTLDLERLLSHQEELTIIKNLIAKKSGRDWSHTPSQVKALHVPTHERQPTPTVFTRPQQPLASSNKPNQK